MKRNTSIILITLGLVVLAAFAIASVPHLINYQGVLTDSGGLPINGTHDLTFTIYPDSAVSAAAYWAETHTGVQFDDGLFHVILGGTTPIPDDLFASPVRWIGITVDATPEMKPRLQITSVPWALHAAVADTVLSGGGGGGELTLPFADSASVGYSAFIIANEDAGGGAIKGENTANNNVGYLGHTLVGVYGISPTAGVRGFNDNGNYGSLGTSTIGVYGQHFDGNYGHLGGGTYGAYGRNTNGHYGYLGGATYGSYGVNANGSRGYLGISVYGVAGYSDTVAVHGYNSDIGNYGRLGTRDYAVYGRYTNGNVGILGALNQGAYGAHANGNLGYLGGTLYGVYGAAPAGAYSGYFAGKVLAEDTIQATAGGFQFPDGTVQTTASMGGVGDGHSLDAADGDPTDAVYVNDLGYVGIGTTSPMGQLDVRLDRDGAMSIAISNHSTGNNSKESLRFMDENGNTAQITAYDVNDPSWPGRLAMENDRDGGSIWLRTNNTDQLSVLNNGNVGIGVVSASEKLQIAGMVHSTIGGFRFPDGTVQTTAGTSPGVLTLPLSDSTTVGYSAFIVKNDGGGAAIKGENKTNSNTGYLGSNLAGVYGISATSGVRGSNENGNYGQLGTSTIGVYGQHFDGHIGKLGGSTYGAYGENTNGHYGYLGADTYGAYGRHNNGNSGYLGYATYGVAGYSDTVAVLGYNSDIGNYGHLGTRDHAVYGRYANGNIGILGALNQGVYGENTYGNWGALGYNDRGVVGNSTDNGGGQTNYGGYFTSTGVKGIGVYGVGPRYGGYFVGEVAASDTIHAIAGGFKFPDGTVQTTADTGDESWAIPYADTTVHEGNAFLIQNDGSTSNAVAIKGISDNGDGVYGDGLIGIRGKGDLFGVIGSNPVAGTSGILGYGAAGVLASNNGAQTQGQLATGSNGVYGTANGNHNGVSGRNNSSGNNGRLGGPDYGVKSEGDLVVEGAGAAYRGDIGPNNGAPFPRPAYDSGWAALDPGAGTALEHDIGGNVDNYVIDMTFKYSATNRIHNTSIGYDKSSSGITGCRWGDLTNTSISIYRGANDVLADSLRVRIWVYN